MAVTQIVYEGVTDAALRAHIQDVAGELDRLVAEYERCLDELERRGGDAWEMTPAAVDYLSAQAAVA